MRKELIPRPLRACLWALLVLALATLYYIALGCPTLSVRQEFRRAEKANMVGPSKIVDRMEALHYSEFDRLLVGETEYGIVFFGRYGSTRTGSKHSGSWIYRFSYIEKTGDITFAAPPNNYGYFGMHKLPVYIFTEHQDAVRATISIQASGIRSNTTNGVTTEAPFAETFAAEATRDKAGFFRFILTAKNNAPHDTWGAENDESYALFCISNLCSTDTYYDKQAVMVFPIDVTLYDAEGNVIVTKTLQLGPYKAEQPEN